MPAPVAKPGAVTRDWPELAGQQLQDTHNNSRTPTMPAPVAKPAHVGPSHATGSSRHTPATPLAFPASA